ncbi:UDP-N-acetyl glucosamine 2-epimerase [Ferruginibacter yonginensis]|uniref:UDP-N-acetyl glucosamine 2-epimerase n=1 Tax=Ferruginibacter yonginensis TaxID=1310416 RepID=A0ABV8QNV8_9BACT
MQLANINKIIHIVGNRPQFVKLAVLHKALATLTNVTQQIVHTGQHFSEQMSGIFFDDLAIPTPNINLQINNTTANHFIGAATEALQQYLINQPNSIVMVYGDTNTTLAASIAAKKVGLPLFHFEAGVRTFDMQMPEEINRVIADRLADVNYCCTTLNNTTLHKEGFGQAIKNEVIITGDLMLDAFLKIPAHDTAITNYDKYVVATIHRAANLSSALYLSEIITALNQIHLQIPVVLPIHPHTQQKINEFGLQPQFDVIPALGYPQMKRLLKDATYVITDSGGTCREAYFLQKQSLIIMDKVFWPEIIAEGAALQTGAQTNEIISNFEKLPHIGASFNAAIFGDGTAAEKITAHIAQYIATH